MNWPSFMAVAVIVLFPMVVFFVAVQKDIVQGLASGSVKGWGSDLRKGKQRRPDAR